MLVLIAKILGWMQLDLTRIFDWARDDLTGRDVI